MEAIQIQPGPLQARGSVLSTGSKEYQKIITNSWNIWSDCNKSVKNFFMLIDGVPVSNSITPKQSHTKDIIDGRVSTKLQRLIIQILFFLFCILQ
jgi:hypothetical protein